MDSPSAEKLVGISRVDRLALAKYYEIDVSESDKKADIVVKVSNYFVSKNIISTEEGSNLMLKEETSTSESGSDSDEGAAKPRKKSSRKREEKLKIEAMKQEAEHKRIELEMKKLELEAKITKEEAEATRREEAAAEEKRQAFEIRKLELLAAGGNNPGAVHASVNAFKVDNAVNSVPIFVESEVDSFFYSLRRWLLKGNGQKNIGALWFRHHLGERPEKCMLQCLWKCPRITSL